jgi:hypothetical protein
MPFQPAHDVKRGLHRLLNAPFDVPVRDPLPLKALSIKLAAASPPHRALFAEYKGVLGGAMRAALEWWEGMITAAMNRGADAATAQKDVYRTVFAGPAARGEVVWAVRTHWLKCVAANREVAPEARVPPQVLLLSWLVDERRDDWVTVLTGMPYWPIGLSADGEWI